MVEASFVQSSGLFRHTGLLTNLGTCLVKEHEPPTTHVSELRHVRDGDVTGVLQDDFGEEGFEALRQGHSCLQVCQHQNVRPNLLDFPPDSCTHLNADWKHGQGSVPCVASVLEEGCLACFELLARLQVEESPRLIQRPVARTKFHGSLRQTLKLGQLVHESLLACLPQELWQAGVLLFNFWGLGLRLKV